MSHEINCILSQIERSLQNDNVEELSILSIIVNSNEFLTNIPIHHLNDLLATYEKLQSVLAILKTHKTLILDELTLLNTNKKALQTYGSLP